MDLILRNARRIGAEHELTDIGIAGGHVAAIEPGLAAEGETIDLGGRLVSPGFVETHIHLDKSCILDRCRSERGDLEEAIAEAAKAKAAFTPEDVHSRAVRTLEKAILQGTTHMRTHLEVDPGVGLRGLEGVLPLIEEYSWAIDLEICVFPQEGLLNNPGTDELMVAALDRGCRVVGGAPYTDSNPPGQIDRVFELARDYDIDSTCIWISARRPRAWISITSAGARRNSNMAAGSPSATSPKLRASRCRHSTPWQSAWRMRAWR
jgi:cytosine deaminase